MNDFTLVASYQNDNNSVRLVWDSTTIVTTQYEIYTSRNSQGPWSLIGKVSKNISAFTHQNVSSTSRNFYIVKTNTFIPQKNEVYSSNLLLVSPIAILSIKDAASVANPTLITDNDLLVDWEPKSVNILTMLGLFVYENADGAAGITEISILAPSNREGFDIEYTSDLVTLNFPNLVSLTEGAYFYIYAGDSLVTVNAPLLQSSQFNDIQISSNDLLTTVNFNSLQQAGNDIRIDNNSSLVDLTFPSLTILTGSLHLSDNALSQASVDSILATLVGCVDGSGDPWANTLDISGGTNAGPSNIESGSNYYILQTVRGAQIYWND
jgi:hypothetical protein